MTTPIQGKKPTERGSGMEVSFTFDNADAIRYEARRIAPGEHAQVMVNGVPVRIERSASEPDVVSVAHVENTNVSKRMWKEFRFLKDCVDSMSMHRIESEIAGDAFTAWHTGILVDIDQARKNIPPWETENAWRSRMDALWLRASSQMQVPQQQDYNTYTVTWEDTLRVFVGTCSGFPWLRCENTDAAGAFRSIHDRTEALLASPELIAGSKKLHSTRDDMRRELDEMFRDVVLSSTEDTPYKTPSDLRKWQDRTLGLILSMDSDLDMIEDDEVILVMMEDIRIRMRH